MINTMSENKAADLLGVKRSTLGLWRRGGKLRPDLIVTGLRPPSVRATADYDATVLEAVLAGESLFEIPE